MKIGNRDYQKFRTYETYMEALNEAARWLKCFHAKIVGTKDGKYTVYIAP